MEEIAEEQIVEDSSSEATEAQEVDDTEASSSDAVETEADLLSVVQDALPTEEAETPQEETEEEVAEVESKEEVETGFAILKALYIRKQGAVLVACPSCGRADVDVISLANKVDQLLKDVKTNIKVAVMGCEVNGPGEAKDADIGIAAGAGRAIIFRKGQKVKVVQENEMLETLMEEVRLASQDQVDTPSIV